MVQQKHVGLDVRTSEVWILDATAIQEMQSGHGKDSVTLAPVNQNRTCQSKPTNTSSVNTFLRERAVVRKGVSRASHQRFWVGIGK